MEVAAERVLGELALAVAVLHPREQPHLAKRQLAEAEGLQHVGMHVGHGLQALHLDLVVAQGLGDGGGAQP
jgi:hypothetical protein